MPAPLKPIIYIAFANDLENPARNLASLAQERENIEAAIKGNPETSGQRNRLAELLGSWDLIAQTNCTPRVFTGPFYSNRVAVFHYGGHAGPEALLFETEDGTNVAATADKVIPFVRDQKSLKLIFLNACSTQQWANELAQGGRGEFCIIATSCPVQDPVAMQFAHDFYICLASDATIQEAFDTAVHGIGVKLTGSTRGFGRMEHHTNGLPWALYPQGTCVAKSWRLSNALRNPLLGIPPLGPEYIIPPSPYVSIRGHEKEDAQIFFGRNAEIREIYDWATRDTFTPVMLLYGQSGSGKSSLLRAGVWPRLEPRASVGYFRREEDLTDDLNFGLSCTTHIADPSQAADAWLRSETPSVILLDQVEEAITHRVHQKDATGTSGANDELKRFFTRIVEIFIDPKTRQPRFPSTKARLILSFRKEFLADIRNPVVDRLPGLVRDLWLERLTEQNIVDIIEGPVLRDDLRAQYKIALEDKSDRQEGFAAYLASRLYDPYSPVATILQLELNRLWDLWHPADPDSLQAVQDPAGLPQQELLACRRQKDPLGRDQSDAAICYSRRLYDTVSTGDALRQFLLDQMLTLDDPALQKGLALDLLYEHTSGLATSQRRTLTDLKKNYTQRISDADLNRLLVRNKELHLLADVSDESDDKIPAGSNSAEPNAAEESATVLAHDTLAPVVRREFDISHKPGPSARRILEDRARGWTGKKKGDYLDAADLHIVRKGLRYMRSTTGDEDRLLRASRKRHRRNIAVVASTLLFVALIGAAIAWQNYKTALSIRLAGDAEQSIADHYDLAALLSAEAYHLKPTAEARDAVVSVYSTRPDAVAYLHPGVNGSGAVAFGPVNSELLVAEDDTVQLWNAAARARMWSTRAQWNIADSGPYNRVSFSPDGTVIALTRFDSLRLWRASDHWMSDLFQNVPDTPGRASFSNDQQYLAVGGSCDEVQVWSLTDWRPLRALRRTRCRADSGVFLEVAIDPIDENLLAVWSTTGRLTLENTRTGALYGELQAASSQGIPSAWRVHDVAPPVFSANGARLATSAVSGGIDVYNTIPESAVALISRISSGDARRLKYFAFNQDGSRLAAATQDGSIGIWDVATGLALRPLSDGPSSIPSASGSSSSTYVVTTFAPDLSGAAEKDANGEILLIDLAHSLGGGPAPDAAENEGSVVHVAYSADGKWIATSTVEGFVTLWDAAAHTPRWVFSAKKIDHGLGFPGQSLTFSADSTVLAFPQEEFEDPNGADRPRIAVHRLDTRSMQLLPDLSDVPEDGETNLRNLAFSPHGQLATISDKGVVRIWDPTGTGPVRRIPGMAGTESSSLAAGIAVSPNGQWLAAVAHQETKVSLWDLTQNRLAFQITSGRPAFSIDTLVFGPGGREGSPSYLAAGGANGFALWSLPARQRLAGDLYQLNMGLVVNSLAFTPDGSLLAVARASGRIELWDTATGQRIGQPLQWPWPVRPASANADPGQVDAEPPGGLAISPDGRHIVAGGWNGSFRVWDWGLDLGAWQSRACSIANRNLTRGEWKRTIGSFPPYRRICPKLPE